MAEKEIRSLVDLEEALALAAREGGCRIRVGNQVAALVSAEDLSDDAATDFLGQPAVAERLDRATRSLQEGRGIPHQEVLKRFDKRKV